MEIQKTSYQGELTRIWAEEQLESQNSFPGLGRGWLLIFTEILLHVKHCTEHVPQIILFNLHNNLLSLVKLLFHIIDEILECWIYGVTHSKSYNQQVAEPYLNTRWTLLPGFLNQWYSSPSMLMTIDGLFSNTSILWAHWHLSFSRKGCRKRA